MKKISYSFAVVLLAVSLLFALSACGENAVNQSVSVANGLAHTYKNQQWTAVAENVKSGWTKRTASFTDENLGAFTVRSTTESGVLTLRLTQGETTKEVDISNYNGAIGMEQFSAGKIVVELRYDTVKEMNATLTWRV